ncbi:peptide/nickel transport system permease protein [Pullulanibacillus pueri]|uniref:Peptide ABC transporter substrate-binding protein n=1 Tax=Pullulanibacillus pueri TaxID=1437324 RepID=A0A8J3EMS8_9BACL|nr:nickel transporter permease [Pullulanibacillus pueri]MBM7683196.1 peptide/nickel transport system permease protein [Pullulanibacillus pueri]GGH85606.1 peptide ABC transporter substrate-binding protein [Pullulanibacillus pueri]
MSTEMRLGDDGDISGTASQQDKKRPFLDALVSILKSKTSLIGLIIIVLLLLVAVFAPLLAPSNPISGGDLFNRYKGPSADHWLGTDELGRDILSRLIYGTRISIQVGIIAVGIALVIGTFLGAISGFFGRWIDMIVMRIVDILMSFPSILLAIAIVAVMGKGLTNTMIAVGIVGIPQFARIVRSSVLSVKETEYVEAARAVGAKSYRVLFRHVLPNCLAPIIVQTTLSIGTAILDAAGLSFLGLGAQPPKPEWGAMLDAGRAALQTAPWVVIFPGLAILVTVLGFNLLGDGLRDALDPRTKK